MASWAAVLALTGFHYSDVSGALTFAASLVPCRWFWSSGSAWGMFEQTPGERGTKVTLTVTKGSMRLCSLTIGGFGALTLPEPQMLAASSIQEYTITRQGNRA